MKKSSLQSTHGNSVVIVIIIIAVLLVGGYLGYTYMAKTGLFGNTASTTNNQKPADPLVIKAISQKDDNLSIDLTKNIKDDGYCVLTLQSKQTLLTIDDSKNNDPKQKQCTGWVIGVKQMPKGEYTATIKLVTPAKSYTAAKTFTLS